MDKKFLQNNGKKVVYRYDPPGTPQKSMHGLAAEEMLCKKLTEIMGWKYAGLFSGGFAVEEAFFIPYDTLTSRDAKHIGIRSGDDLLGGVVPSPYMRNKTIMHPLIGAGAVRPEGWDDFLSKEIATVSLSGYSVFSIKDAIQAGSLLLTGGAVRIKLPLQDSGLGQARIHDEQEFKAFIESLNESEISQSGLVIERNLDKIETFNVGQITVGNSVLSYHGIQRSTLNNEGEAVYGGSDLLFVRGSWAMLAPYLEDEKSKVTLELSRSFDAIIDKREGFIISRKNFDVGIGFDEHGVAHAGVLEQSWRTGGATMAELAALELFTRNPDIVAAKISCVKEFKKSASCPDNAAFFLQVDDPILGPVTRYSFVEKVIA